jgi:hypothetical protein
LVHAIGDKQQKLLRPSFGKKDQTTNEKTTDEKENKEC